MAFIIKVTVKVGLEGTYLNTVKTIYNKLLANIIINVEKFEAIILTSGMRQDCPLSPLFFNIILEALSIRQSTGKITIPEFQYLLQSNNYKNSMVLT